MKNIQYSLERFVGTGELSIADYSQRNDAFEEDDLTVLDNLIYSTESVPMTNWPHADVRAIAREVLNATHAIAAIRPWALRPVVPTHMVAAIKRILDPFYKTRNFTVDLLQRELRMIPDQTFTPDGRTGEALSQHLSLIAGDKHQFFGAESSFLTAQYHDSMSLVFRHKRISLEDARISLAAAVGSRVLSDLVSDRGGANSLEHFQQNMKEHLERCYAPAEKTEKSGNVPEWAIDVYANYLRGWIADFIPADPDLISYFRRRVFLA